ncbi:helix-turn-helix domain-containing protein, partial [Brucella cytisi]
YMTVAEVAEELRVTPMTVYRWIADGEIPALKLGRRTYRIFREDYLAYRDQRHQDAHDRADAAGRPAPAPHVPGQTEFPMPRVMPGPIDGIAAL